VAQPVDAGDDEGQDEDEVAVDPDVVGEVVVEVPVDRHIKLLLVEKGHYIDNWIALQR